ncbi:MAG: ppsA, partial [Patescibacteria group bacterium]|nr:ppsA [Patescibacteria group bacterium]
MSVIRFFEDLSKGDTAIAGGKGASLGEMTRAGIPVPPGFVILTEAFETFLDHAGIGAEITDKLKDLDHQDDEALSHVSAFIRKLILETPIPQDLQDTISKAFSRLGCKYVAVRSSATAEDGLEASWAGELDSFLNTKESDLLQNVRECWASLYNPRALFYRFEKGFAKKSVSLAVVVQKMVDSEVSGIAFSVHPVTKEHHKMLIEAGYGLGEAIVSGSITPDNYTIDKQDRSIAHGISTQERALVQGANGGNEWIPVLPENASRQKLSNEEIVKLATLVLKIEDHYGFPCDIEWAKSGDKLYIVQSRPITTLGKAGNEGTPLYNKIFTRDFSLPMLEVWYKGEAWDPKPWSSERQPYLPYIVFVREDDTVKSYYDDKGVEWIKAHLKEAIGNDETFLRTLEHEVSQRLERIQPIYEEERLLDRDQLLAFIDDFRSVYPWVEAMWWICEMTPEELGSADISSVQALRERTGKLSSGT